MEQLTRFRSLERIDVSMSRLDHTTMQSLCKITSLKSLVFDACYLTDEDFAQLAALSQLEELTIDHCDQITSTGFESLRKLDKIRKLFLGCPKADGRIVQIVSQFPDLNSLHLDARILTDTDLDRLSRMTQLKFLSLNLDRSPVTDFGINQLSKLVQLERLDLDGCCNITDDGLAFLQRLPCLNQLSLLNIPLVTDHGLTTVLKNIPLTSLNINQGKRLTDTTLEFLEQFPTLKELRFTGRVKFSKATVARFRANRPNCKLTITNTSWLEIGCACLFFLCVIGGALGLVGYGIMKLIQSFM